MSTHLALAAGLLVGSCTAHAQHTPPLAYQLTAHHSGVPPSVLFAVALQESGTMLSGRLIPWPWTLNIAGRAHRYENRSDSCSALRYSLRRLPGTRVDVGLAQINVGYHGHRVREPCEFLDPYRNLAIAATLLREHHTPGQDWLTAIGRYHRPAGGTPAERYRSSVQTHLKRVLGSNGSTRSSGTHP